MCIIGGGGGLTFVAIGVPLILLFTWMRRLRKSPYFNKAYDEFYGRLELPDAVNRGIKAWNCLNPRCRHHNKAGSHFCARCGATRGYTYRASVAEDPAD